MRRSGWLALACVLLAATASRAAKLEIVYTGDVRGTLGVCG